MANNRLGKRAPQAENTPRLGGKIPPESLDVLVLAHVFPRALDDSMGAFLLHLADALTEYGVTTRVVAPHAPLLQDEERLGTAQVYRFHYAPAQFERLAYTGTMHEQVGGGLSTKFLFGLLNAAFLVKVLALVRARKPQVLHAHWWLPGGLVGALASWVTGVPLVITTHGTDVEILRRTRWARPLARFALARARAVTCGSTYLREQLLTLGVAEPERVSVVPMPVNPLFQGSLVEYRDAPARVLTVARLTRQKNIDTLIEAMALLKERGCAAQLTVIGEGPARAALENHVDKLGLEECVEFLGALPQQELPRYYADASVFVLPSVREGMGLVLAEALLCGSPVIGTNSGGIPDLVKDGETGLLVPEGDAEALAAALEKLLQDRVLARGLAARGHAWVSEHYTRERVAQEFAEVFERVRT